MDNKLIVIAKILIIIIIFGGLGLILKGILKKREHHVIIGTNNAIAKKALLIETKPRPSSDNNLEVCAQGPMTPGIDVFDGDMGKNWLVLKKSGIRFAYIKATEGITIRSTDILSDWQKTREANILHGSYHFFHADDNPHQQAQFFLKHMGPIDDMTLPPMLDWEVTDNQPNDVQIKNAKIWLEDVYHATGLKPIIYLSPDFFNALGNPQEFAEYPLFIADYDRKCPKVPPPWSNWLFWQRGIGHINGMEDPADEDVYQGTIDEASDASLIKK